MSLEAVIRKKLARFTLDVSLSADNEYVGLLGASGSGKSMTLKCIAGIETPDSGYIRINGKTVFDSEAGINEKPGRRKCGFLFQNYALFPTMTIAQNIELVLHRLERGERKKKTAEILSRFGISDIADCTSGRLSGGQQQRAALARIMVNNPEIIMLDEPFSALDAYIKQQIEASVIEMLSDFKRTVLFVSHDRDEIFRICNTIAVVSDGKISRYGASRDVFASPETVAAARLTGCRNVARFIRGGNRSVFIPDWNIRLTTAADVRQNVGYVGIRAHYIRKANASDAVNAYDFTILKTRNSPFSVSVFLAVPGAALPIDWETAVNEGTILSDTHPGSTVERVCIPPESIMLLSE